VTLSNLGRWAVPAAFAALAVAVPGASAAGPGYCDPGSTQFDPPDVPPGGAPLSAAKGVTRRWLTVDGIHTPVLTSGPARSREAVVFVHGSPGSSQSWLDLLPRVGAMGRRAIAFDLPGYGHATKPWQPVTDFRFGGEFLEHLLRRLGVERVQLVIHDLGGVTGLQWAARHPRRLIGAVVIASGLLGYRHHALAQVSRRPVVGEAFWAAVDRQAWRYGMQIGQDERPLPFAFLDQIYDDLDRATRCTIIHLYRSAEASEVEAVGEAQARVLKRRRRPALIVWGAHDPYLPPAMAKRQREPFPAASVHVLDGSGHWPFADDPVRTRALVLPFVRCLPTGRRDRIRLVARPRRVRAGGRVTIRFRARVRSEGRARPVCGAAVRLAGRGVRTGPRGWARMALPSLPAGRHRARASKPGLRDGRASVTAESQ
jgi:pimeloyl-ACP methyl ester carboxylesterase